MEQYEIWVRENTHSDCQWDYYETVIGLLLAQERASALSARYLGGAQIIQSFGIFFDRKERVK